MGSNFVVRTETFRRLGGFDEKFGAGAYWGSGEETDFAWKAHFAHVPMAYRPELVVHHVRPYAGSLADSCRKGFRYGVGKGALVSKWLLERRRLVVLMEMLEMLFIPVVQIVADFLRGRWRNLPVYPCVLAGRVLGFLRRMAGEGR